MAVRLMTRERTQVQKAVLDCAKNEFARWEVRGEYKNPAALLRSFRKRLESSRAVDALISDERLPLRVIARIFQLIVDFYDDSKIPRERPPRWQQDRARHCAGEERFRNEISVLERALVDARKKRCSALSIEIESNIERRRNTLEQLELLREYQEQHAPPGRPIRPPVGAPKRADTVLAERLEMTLARREPVPAGKPPRWIEPPHLESSERNKLIADLISDFDRERTPEQIRALLKDARRREGSPPGGIASYAVQTAARLSPRT